MQNSKYRGTFINALTGKDVKGNGHVLFLINVTNIRRVWQADYRNKNSVDSSCSVAGFRTLCLPNSSHVLIHFPPLFRKIPPIRHLAMKFVEKGDVFTEYDYRQGARKDCLLCQRCKGIYIYNMDLSSDCRPMSDLQDIGSGF